MSQPRQPQQPNTEEHSKETNTTDPKAYDKLVDDIAERVWALWRAELRQAQERRGSIRRR